MSNLGKKTCRVCGQLVMHVTELGADPGGLPTPVHVKGKRHQDALEAQTLDVTYVTGLVSCCTYRIETYANGTKAVFQVIGERGSFEEDPREWVVFKLLPEHGHYGRIILRELGIDPGLFPAKAVAA